MTNSAALGNDIRLQYAQSLTRLAQLRLDWDDDWCGTPPKKFPPKKHHFEGLEDIFNQTTRWTPAPTPWPSRKPTRSGWAWRSRRGSPILRISRTAMAALLA